MNESKRPPGVVKPGHIGSLICMPKNFYQWIVAKTARAAKPASASVEQQAQAGDPEAQFQLALKCSTVAGLDKDEMRAAAWFQKAAKQNHGLAQFNLEERFAGGRGVTQDVARSQSWFRRAAHLGVAGAQFNLGRACQRASLDGSATAATEARIEAYMWYELAAAQNYAAAVGNSALLTLKMTRNDVAEARRRVNACEKKPRPGSETAISSVKQESSR